MLKQTKLPTLESYRKSLESGQALIPETKGRLLEGMPKAQHPIYQAWRRMMMMKSRVPVQPLLQDFEPYYLWVRESIGSVSLTLDRKIKVITLDKSSGYQTNNCRILVMSKNKEGAYYDPHTQLNNYQQIKFAEMFTKGLSAKFMAETLGVPQHKMNRILAYYKSEQERKANEQ